MRSAAVQGQLRGTGPYDRADDAADTLVRLSCGARADADVVRSGGHVMPASAFGRRDLLQRLRGGRGSFGIVSRLEFTRYPVLAVPGGLRSQNVRPAR